MSSRSCWAVVIPMANEEEGFHEFTDRLDRVMNELPQGKAYLVLDKASRDRTLELSQDLAKRNNRFEVVWAPENRCVVDAYINGFKVAFRNLHDPIIEMDAGMSHDPAALPIFLESLSRGYDCAFGSRFTAGGSMAESPLRRRLLSVAGTFLANLMLGTKLHDMTSGYEGFRRDVMEGILNYQLKSCGHFYQTEIRYLLRKRKAIEVPIRYSAPSKRVSRKSLLNAIETLFYYFRLRLNGCAPSI